MTPAVDASPPSRELAAVLRELSRASDELGRADLANRARAAGARVARPNTLVCVAGEYKQGKSSLVNALLGEQVCPVDDDLATSVITLLHHAEQPVIRARRREAGTVTVDEVPLDALARLTTEAGNPGNERNLERVDVGLPNPVLARGLALVDTPGMGGLGAGHAAATLAFLPYADGLVFVSAATAELSGPEIEFLHRARELCPVVLFALTKVDIAPHWRRIEALDRAHLADAGLAIPIVPIASPLRWIARGGRDDALERDSGIPQLLELLERDVLERARAGAAQRASVEGRGVLDQLLGALRTEVALLEDASKLPLRVRDLEEAQARLANLRGPGARWTVLVADRLADLAAEGTHRFRGAIRSIGRELDEAVEGVDTAADWEHLGRELCTRVADAVAEVFGALESGVRTLHAEVAALLRDEAISAPADLQLAPIDVSRLWEPLEFEERASRFGAFGGRAMSGLRGGYSGLFAFSILGRFLPAGAAAVLLSNPVSLGIGIAFAGRALLDANKRRLAGQRQRARAAGRQFLDDVQFEVGTQLGDTVRTLQRVLRDEFSDRVSELQRTYSETLQRAQADAERSQADRARRADADRAAIARLEAIDGRLGQAT